MEGSQWRLPKFQKRTVDAATSAERDIYLWDTELKGFGLKVTPAGHKVYLVQYRLGGRTGRTRRVTIGKHGSPLTADGARAKARRLLGEVAAGRDPAEARDEALKDISVARLCDIYLAEGCATQKRSTLYSDRGRISRHIKPLIGRKRVRAVTRGDIERFMQDVAAGKTACDEKIGSRARSIVRGGKGAANRTVALLSSILSFAERRGIAVQNPASRIKKFPGQTKERFLTAAELAKLGDTLVDAEKDGRNIWILAAIRLLALTGCRKSEILTLQWQYVDWENSCLRLPDSKTGAKVVPLGAAALELLDSLPRLHDNPYVLPSTKSRGHLVGLQKAWSQIRSDAGLGDVRLHDLRHSFASIAVAGGDSLYLVGKVLGHRQARTTERYAHLADDPLKAVADKTAGHIAAATSVGNGGAEVVELPKRKA